MAREILIYSTGEVIGDGIIKLPWIGGLRDAMPDARIVWCAASGETVYATTLRPLAQRYIDEIISEQGLERGAFGLWGPAPFGGRRFDLVVDTQSDWRQTIAVRRAAAGPFIAATLGFLLSSRRPRAKPPIQIGPRIGLLFSLAAGAQVTPTDPWKADAAALAKAARLLPDGPAYVGLAPGTGGREKRWPLERYIALARRLAASRRAPVFILGPDEAGEAAKIAAAVPQARFPDTRAIAGDDAGGPRLVIALASRLAAAVANDAGPGHMLAAGGAPLVSLHRSARTAEKFRPAADRLELLIADNGDMSSIGLDAVEAAIGRLARVKGA
ncbi:MAG TPA: glycosyltransferase family 9 protein [Caulobacteraceae bacterium]|nr:glycosyltransferase family 9 protein [Caulobacteraceae bacterium]